ncbi:MAG: winged helix-turn-helix transcriptional regulator, partial [Microcoleus sp. SIO2G3]|nr:winged helix-turn-helix transcriptional regulator [Microcoleus sp. SIO2G3]
SSDRRVVRIWLTEEGKRLMHILPPVGAQTIERATADISQAQQEAILQVLEQIIHNLL